MLFCCCSTAVKRVVVACSFHTFMDIAINQPLCTCNLTDRMKMYVQRQCRSLPRQPSSHLLCLLAAYSSAISCRDDRNLSMQLLRQRSSRLLRLSAG